MLNGAGRYRSSFHAQCAAALLTLFAMLEDRIIELETRLVYQEDTLRVLNEVLTRQQDQIDRLLAVTRALQERLKALPQEEGQGYSLADEVPPHY